MKLSSRTRYGMRAILELALEYGNSPLQIKTIAEREDISNKYLEQLIAMLKASGLVRSIRGPRGGYRCCSGVRAFVATGHFRHAEEGVPQHPCFAFATLARRGTHQCIEPRDLANRGRLAGDAFVGTVPVHRRRGIPQGDGLSLDERILRILP